MNKNVNSCKMANEFMSLNYGTKPTGVKLEVINVEINPETVIQDFAGAYLYEIQRRNPIRAQEISLTEEDVYEYFKTLIAIRVQYVNNSLKCWREARQLYIPTWIQFVLSQIGEVVKYNYGLKFIPKFEYTIDISKALETSFRIASFKQDGLTMHRDAFPKSREGDEDTMSMALIDGYIMAMSDLSHPISSYVSAFIGAKLEEEHAFKMLYRVRYDDIDYIRNMLIYEEVLKC